jgi:cation:H+ antiporter
MIVIELLMGLVLILSGAHLFTNAIEWFGKRLNLSQGAVGSVLAAVGTALPESMIPLVAIISGHGVESSHIGTGAILGAPFMLSTLGLFVVGLSAIAFRKRRKTGSFVRMEKEQLTRDLSFFIIFYAVALGAAFVTIPWLKYSIAFGLWGGYIYYVYLTVTAECHDMEECAPLFFHKGAETPNMNRIVFQLISALGLIIGGAALFVSGVEGAAVYLGIPSLIVALILAPVATELPEKLNSVIWIKEGKDTLSLGNMTGAMVFQSSILPGVGILGTPWALEGLSLISVIMALIAGIYLFILNRIKKGQVAGYLLGIPAILYIIFFIMVINSLR